MNNVKIELEICPFCDNLVNIINIEDAFKDHKIIDYKCECGWEHSKTVHKKKLYNL